MKKFVGGAVALAVTMAVACGANAAEVIVTDLNPQGWSNPAIENSGGGSSAITSASARSGNGSIELFGDRTRWVLGDTPKALGPGASLGLLSDFTDLSFEYRIDPTSASNLGAQYSPALRLTVWDGSAKFEYVYERVYQAGGYAGAAAIGAWNTTTSSSTFYQRVVNTSNNTAPSGTENTQATLSDWAAGLSGSAYVTAVYVGVGSSVGSNYHVYVDNITFGGDTYNFETAVVPEPATWAMMIMGLGAAGSVLRRRRALAQA